MAVSGIEAGQLTKRVSLQALPANQAKSVQWNEPTYGDWSTAATVWGKIEPLSGRELVFAAQVVADATHQVTVRYYAGLSPRMRFLYTDDVTGAQRTLNIEYVKDEDERHVKQICFCREAAQ